jgi:hypothetical protein
MTAPSAPPPPSIDPQVHARYLDYRERHAYFGNQITKLLTRAEFMPLDAEHMALAAKPEVDRDDEEVERLEELASVLFRD